MTQRLVTECYPWFRLRKHAGSWRADGDANVRYGERLSGDSVTEQGVTGGWLYENGSLIVENDVLGFLPIFISYSGDEFLVAPSPLVIAALRDKAQLDPDAMAFFLKFGYFIGEDTPFAGVSGLPPGARVTWRNGVVEQTCAPLSAPAPLDVSRDEALDRYNALFAQSMARRRPGPGANVLIPLSGGMDSRHIVLEAAAQSSGTAAADTGKAANIVAATSSLWRSSQAGSPEMTAAAQLAERVHIPHRIIPAVRNVIKNEMRKNLLTGFCSDEQSLISGLISQVAPPEYVYDGIGGDILSDGDFCQPVFDKHIEQRNTQALIESFFPYNDEVCESLWPLIKPLAGGRDIPSDGSHIVKTVAAQFARLQTFRNPAVAYFFFARTRREISLAPFLLWGAAGRAYAPFLDYDLVMYLLSLPADHFRDGKFHSDAIARGYPHVSDVPYGDQSATPSLPSQINLMAQVIRSGFLADSERPLTGAAASLRFFAHYFRNRSHGANWRLLHLVLQLVRVMRSGPAMARLDGADRFKFSHDAQFRPGCAPKPRLSV